MKQMATFNRPLVAGLAMCTAVMALPVSVFAQDLGSVTIATHLDVDTLDPTQNINTHQRWIYRHIFDPLITHDTEGNVQPALATRWEQVAPDRWRFWLRDDVVFHNGEPFDAEDVAYTVTLMQRTESQARSYYSEFVSAEVVDEFTIDLVTDGPYSGTLQLIADYLNPVPSEYYEEVGGESFASNPVGTGAYQLAEWRRGDRVILEPFADWWHGTPSAEEVVFWAIPEASTRVAALINGEADVAVAVPPIQVERIESADGVHIEVSSASVQPIWGGIIIDREGLTDPRVRQAINYAVNKQAIVDRLLLGYGDVMGQPCPPNTSCYNSEIEPYHYDPDRARELLEEAGVENLTVDLNFPTGVVPQGDVLAQAIAADLERVGIEVNIRQDEWSVFAGNLFDFETMHSGLGDTFLMYYKAGPTLQRVVATVLVSDRNWNWPHYDNARVDELWDSAESATDPQEQHDALMEMAQIVHDEAPWIFLYAPLSLWGVNDRLEWQARGDDFIYVEDMVSAE